MQQVVVALIVAVAALYALWHFMPARWRQSLAARLGLGAGVGQGGCHDCGGCNACPPPGIKKK